MKINITHYFLIGFLILVNLLLLGNTLNLLLTIGQIIFLVVLLLKGKLNEVVLWHIIFTITSISSTTSSLDAAEASIFNYSRLKLLGPIGFSQAFSILLLILTFNKRISFKGVLINKFYKICVFLAFNGIIFGIIGLLFHDYFLDYFVGRVVYITSILINLILLLRVLNIDILRSIYGLSFVLLSISPIITTISYLLGIRGTYSIFDTVIQTEIDFFSIILLFYIFSDKFKPLYIISLLCLTFNLAVSGGGREILIIIFGILTFVWLSFNPSVNKIYPFKTSVSKAVILIITFSLGFGSVIFLNDNLFLVKLDQVLSLKYIFLAFTDINYLKFIAVSPYIRIAEIMNVISEMSSNPIYFLFGKGYGGYFEDSLNLFHGIGNLDRGGFREDIVKLGKFPTAHSMYPTTLLYHGVIGLGLILALGIKYVKKIKISYMAFAAFPFLLITFYFNPQFAITGTFFLIAAEFEFLNNEEKNIIH